MKSEVKVLKTAYFVRHGQSEANIAPVYQGPDSPLSEQGQKQVKLIAERASKLNFDVIIASPFLRTKETAEAISKLTKKEIEYSDLFVEMGKPTKLNDAPADDPNAKELHTKWIATMYDTGQQVEDGENYESHTTRAEQAINFLTDREEKNILVVTHGYFLRTIVAKILVKDLLTPEIFKNIQRSAAMENTGLTILQYCLYPNGDMSWRLWIYNDHAHLAD